MAARTTVGGPNNRPGWIEAEQRYDTSEGSAYWDRTPTDPNNPNFEQIGVSGGWQRAGISRINNPDSLQYDPAMVTMMESSGDLSGWWERSLPGGSSEVAQRAADGSFATGSYAHHKNDDSAFMNAAMLAAAGVGATVYGAGLGAGAAGTGGTAAGTVGSTAAEQIALMQANGLTAAEISAATGGQVAGYTAADIAAMSGAGAGAGGGSAASAASNGVQASTATGPSSTSGFWNGTDFSGTAASAGGKALATGLGVSDWIQLAGLGASVWGSSKAQDSADDFAASQSAMSKEMLDFAKQQWSEGSEFRTAAQKRSLEVSDAQLASMKQQDGLAKEYADYNRATFRPLEQGIVADASGYDTPAKRAAAANTAMADVNAASAASREAGMRTMAANGVNPGSARALSAQAGSEVEQAKALAGAAFQARKGVETTGFARQMDAASLGRNLPSSQATSAGLAINAGNSAVNTAAVPTTLNNQSTAAMTNAYQAAGGLNSAAASIYQRSADASSQLWNQLGATAGRIATSDENMKRDIEPADPEEALQQVTDTPVSKFKYDPAAMASAGIPMPAEPGAEYTGPMAGDVQETMGSGAAPGGKKLDLVTMNGRTMLAIQALDKKVNQLAAMLGGGRLQAGAPA